MTHLPPLMASVMWTEVRMVGCQIVPVLSAALTPLIAIIAVYIAYQQHRTSRDKLRLDLYDRRFELYSALVDLCGSVASSGAPGSTEFDRFLQARHRTQFLFDPGLAAHLETMRQKAIRVQYLRKLLDDDSRLPVGDDRTRGAKEHSDLMKWFADQIKESRLQFAKYFAFK